MLVPARILPAQRVVLDTGGSYVAPVVEPVLAPALSADQRIAAGATPTEDERNAVASSLAAFGATTTGPASYLALRGGVGGRAELQGALVNLRTARLGVRRALGFGPDEKWAFAMGLAARAGLDVLRHRAVLPGAEVQGAEVLGGDITAQLGRTSSELYDLWLGARAGYTFGGARVSHAAFAAAGEAVATRAARVHRVEMAVNLGLRVGFGRFAAVVELDAVTALWFGSVDGSNAPVRGASFTLIPATALAISF
jgi:hypothetical protein